MLQESGRCRRVSRVPALQRYLQAELPRRSWSIPEFAARVDGMSQSNAYRIIRDGFDNVEFATFEAIAATLGMSPAELAVAIGKGSAVDDPEEAQVIAAYRQIAIEKRAAAFDMLRGLAVQPTTPPDANRRRRRVANRPAERDPRVTSQDSHEQEPPLLPALYGLRWHAGSGRRLVTAGA